MQWWYYDFFSDDGLIGVLAFIPRKWWSNTQTESANDAFVMLSLLQADGRMEQYAEELDLGQLVLKGNRLQIEDCITLDYNVENGRSHHQLKFDFGGIRGWLDIAPHTDPFSALPLGTLSGLARMLGGPSEWSRSQFRYVSQIPAAPYRGSSSRQERKPNSPGTRTTNKEGLTMNPTVSTKDGIGSTFFTRNAIFSVYPKAIFMFD